MIISKKSGETAGYPVASTASYYLASSFVAAHVFNQPTAFIMQTLFSFSVDTHFRGCGFVGGRTITTKIHKLNRTMEFICTFELTELRIDYSMRRGISNKSNGTADRCPKTTNMGNALVTYDLVHGKPMVI